MRRFAILLVFLFTAFAAYAGEPVWTEPGAPGVDVHVYLFWSKNCPHCLEARPRILELAARHPWIRLHDHELTAREENVRIFMDLAAHLGKEARVVPTLFYCGRMEEGFDAGAEGVAAFLSCLEDCRRGGAQAAGGAILLPWFGEIDPASWSLPLLTVVIAGLDAFNPCAFFILLVLLSLLVHQQERRRMVLIGGVFVAFSGLMYFAFMAAWLNIFLMLGSLPWVTGAAGALALAMGLINVKDFVRFREGLSLAIPESGKADIFQHARRLLDAGSLPAMLAATVVLAISANFYELLCTAGFPMVFTRLLTLQEGGAARHYLYLALYNVVYVLPLLAIVLVFVRTMGARRMSEREGRLLKLLSGLMMLGLGGALLVVPDALGHTSVALAIPLLALALTWLAARHIPS